MTAREHFVYRLYDAHGQLLYVGCSKRLDKRWQEHRAARPGMTAIASRCKLQGPFTREVARQIERDAIRSEEPLYGWTPTRHREQRVRDLWIDRRWRDLNAEGMDAYKAIHQAVTEAQEQFPDPYEHERIAMRPAEVSA